MFLQTWVTFALWLLDPGYWTVYRCFNQIATKVCSESGAQCWGYSDGQKLGRNIAFWGGRYIWEKTFSSTALVNNVKTGAEVLKNCKDLYSSRWRNKDLWVCEVWMEVWRMCGNVKDGMVVGKSSGTGPLAIGSHLQKTEPWEWPGWVTCWAVAGTLEATLTR